MHRGPMLIYVCECLNRNFVGSTNTISICLILLTIYIFIPVSGCVGRGPSALVCPGAYNAFKMALYTTTTSLPLFLDLTNVGLLVWIFLWQWWSSFGVVDIRVDGTLVCTMYFRLLTFSWNLVGKRQVGIL